MSDLEKAIVAMVEVFVKYAGTDDDKRKLSNAELSTLIKDQLSSPELKVRERERQRKAFNCTMYTINTEDKTYRTQLALN